MKNYDLEKLIDLAFTDGYLDNKEYEVIKAKALKLGIDLEEMEVILSAKLQQIAKSKPIPKDKCPSCGEKVGPKDLFCPSCDGRLPEYNEISTPPTLETTVAYYPIQNTIESTPKEKGSDETIKSRINDSLKSDGFSNKTNVYYNHSESKTPNNYASRNRKESAVAVADAYNRLVENEGQYGMGKATWRWFLLAGTFGLYGVYKRFIKKTDVFDISSVDIYHNDALRNIDVLEQRFNNTPQFLPVKKKLVNETNKAAFRIKARIVVSSFVVFSLLIGMFFLGKYLKSSVKGIQPDTGLTRNEEQELKSKYKDNFIPSEQIKVYKAISENSPNEALKLYNNLPKSLRYPNLLTDISIAETDSLYVAGKHEQALEMINFLAETGNYKTDQRIEQAYDRYIGGIVTDLIKNNEFEKAKKMAGFAYISKQVELNNEIDKAIILKKAKNKTNK